MMFFPPFYPTYYRNMNYRNPNYSNGDFENTNYKNNFNENINYQRNNESSFKESTTTLNNKENHSKYNNNFNKKDMHDNCNNTDTEYFEIFGLKLYFDDILLICMIFFLYNEGVQDQMLFISLILLLLS